MSFKIKYNSPVVLTFSLLCILVLGLDHMMGGNFNGFLALRGHWNMSLHTYVGYVFAHADIKHLMGNLTFILLLGPALEEKYGSRTLLYLILITALVTALLNIVLFDSWIIGASGIVFMFILLISFSGKESTGIPLTFILVLLLFLGGEIINGFKQNNISEFGHILGGVCGSIFGFMHQKRKLNLELK